MAVRWKDWRLYRKYDKDPWQLFDLKSDPRAIDRSLKPSDRGRFVCPPCPMGCDARATGADPEQGESGDNDPRVTVGSHSFVNEGVYF